VVVANGATIKLGSAGKVCVYTQQATDLIVDVTGYHPSRSLSAEVTWVVTSRDDSVVKFVVTDRSGRNFGSAPVQNPRTIYVKSLLSAAPTTDRPVRVHMVGNYRNGSDPLVCGPIPRPGWVTVCVGFPLMQFGDSDFRDIPNHPVDVSTVLDVLEADSALVGNVDTAEVHYSGTSMPAISGTLFVSPRSSDGRITTMLLNVGFAPYWAPGMRIKANWDAGPQILMTNALNDAVISNEVARNTMIAAGGSRNVEMIVMTNGTHSNSVANCNQASVWIDQWLDHYVYKLGAAPRSTDHANACWKYGPQPGGTSGYSPLTPAEYRTDPANWPPL
jgi:hypothetical protein